MKIKQEIIIKGIEVRFWMVKKGVDDIDIMCEMDGQEPIRLLRLRPDGCVGLYKIENTAYPFDRTEDGYIVCR